MEFGVGVRARSEWNFECRVGVRARSEWNLEWVCGRGLNGIWSGCDFDDSRALLVHVIL